MAQIDEASIAKLKSTHGDVFSANFPSGSQFVFRRPRRAEYDMWLDSKDKETPRSVAAKQLAQACLVFPENGYGEFLSALDELPGALNASEGILDALVEMAGGLGGKITIKKA